MQIRATPYGRHQGRTPREPALRSAPTRSSSVSSGTVGWPVQQPRPAPAGTGGTPRSRKHRPCRRWGGLPHGRRGASSVRRCRYRCWWSVPETMATSQSGATPGYSVPRLRVDRRRHATRYGGAATDGNGLARTSAPATGSCAIQVLTGLSIDNEPTLELGPMRESGPPSPKAATRGGGRRPGDQAHAGADDAARRIWQGTGGHGSMTVDNALHEGTPGTRRTLRGRPDW